MITSCDQNAANRCLNLKSCDPYATTTHLNIKSRDPCAANQLKTNQQSVSSTSLYSSGGILKATRCFPSVEVFPVCSGKPIASECASSLDTGD